MPPMAIRFDDQIEAKLRCKAEEEETTLSKFVSLLAPRERRGAEQTCSFDRDFAVCRTKARKRLKNVFDKA